MRARAEILKREGTVFESQLPGNGSFCKKIVLPFSEHDDIIETQTRNCVRSLLIHAPPLTPKEEAVPKQNHW